MSGGEEGRRRRGGGKEGGVGDIRKRGEGLFQRTHFFFLSFFLFFSN